MPSILTCGTLTDLVQQTASMLTGCWTAGLQGTESWTTMISDVGDQSMCEDSVGSDHIRLESQLPYLIKGSKGIVGDHFRLGSLLPHLKRAATPSPSTSPDHRRGDRITSESLLLDFIEEQHTRSRCQIKGWSPSCPLSAMSGKALSVFVACSHVRTHSR